MAKKKQKLAEIARKKRHLHLIEKLHGGKSLTEREIRQLEEYERDPLPDTVVRTCYEVGRGLGVSERTVQRWVREGMPKTKDGFYDLEEIKEWQIKRIEQNKDDDQERKEYWEQKLLRGKVEKIEFEIKQMTGELVSKEEVEQERVARIMAVKRAFLALPTALAPVLAMKEPREIQTVLYEAIGEIIDDFAGVRKIKKHEKKESGPVDSV